MTKFLTFKHWQLFLIFLGIPMIFQFVITGVFLTNNSLANTFELFTYLMFFMVGLFFSWFYSLGVNLHKKLPETVNMNLNKFKLFLLIPLIYLLVITILTSSKFTGISASHDLNPVAFGLIIPIHLFSMFCIFYCLYFISKALKSVEWQKQVTFSDFAGEFFLLWFFPIGIWIIQPRLNKLFDQK